MLGLDPGDVHLDAAATSFGAVLSSLSNVARTVSIGGGWGSRRKESARAPTPGATVCSAVIRYVQNDPDWLSAWSRESHAADRSPAGAAASHSASSVVLPKPAGAETSVSFDSAPRLKRSLSLGRPT